MIEKYKGDAPENVLTPQEAKQKKPFYKDWKFWVLTGFMSVFAFCSIYGFALAKRYTDAMNQATALVSERQESEKGSVASDQSLGKVPFSPKMIGGRHDNIAFEWWPSATGYFGLNGETMEWGASLPFFNIQFDNTLQKYTLRLTWAGYYEMSLLDYVSDYTFETFNHQGFTIDQTYSNGIGRLVFDYVGLPMHFKGVFHFDPYQTGYTQGESDGYSDGYTEGYADGESDGYQEGYDDGYEALAGSQTINVTFDDGFPTLNQINYSWSVDGSVVDSGSLVVRANVQIPVKTFTRPGGYTHTAELNLWSENDEPLVIAYGRHEGLVIGGQQTYIYDTYNKTNSYEFGENNRYVWYVPTYWPNALFYIYSYGTWNQGYSNDCYFVFDPEHNERSKVGAYADGYQDGYHDATESGDAYDAGKEAGYEQGYQTGVTDGKNQGYAEATGGTKALAYMFVTAFQQPFDQLYRFLNFNLLGINLLALFSALVTLSLGIYVLKKVL